MLPVATRLVCQSYAEAPTAGTARTTHDKPPEADQRSRHTVPAHCLRYQPQTRLATCKSDTQDPWQEPALRSAPSTKPPCHESTSIAECRSQICNTCARGDAGQSSAGHNEPTYLLLKSQSRRAILQTESSRAADDDEVPCVARSRARRGATWNACVCFANHPTHSGQTPALQNAATCDDLMLRRNHRDEMSASDPPFPIANPSALDR